jgi:apolipoprotein N-acyltransferase
MTPEGGTPEGHGGGRAGAPVKPALRLLAAPATGALLAAAFPALDLGPLARVALVPLLLAVDPLTTSDRATPRPGPPRVLAAT